MRATDKTEVKISDSQVLSPWLLWNCLFALRLATSAAWWMWRRNESDWLNMRRQCFVSLIWKGGDLSKHKFSTRSRNRMQGTGWWSVEDSLCKLTRSTVRFVELTHIQTPGKIWCKTKIYVFHSAHQSTLFIGLIYKQVLQWLAFVSSYFASNSKRDVVLMYNRIHCSPIISFGMIKHILTELLHMR